MLCLPWFLGLTRWVGCCMVAVAGLVGDAWGREMVFLQQSKYARRHARRQAGLHKARGPGA